MNWVVFISQTGSEVMSLSKKIGKVPQIIVTNNVVKLSVEVKNWISEERIDVFSLTRKPSLEHFIKLSTHIDSNSLITLHGFTRIIPKEFIDKFSRIFNGHPGLITEYIELRGLDPQKRAFDSQYRKIGSVIHKVILEVDGGEIVCSANISLNDYTSLEEYYSLLKHTSLVTWLLFFNCRLYEN